MRELLGKARKRKKIIFKKRYFIKNMEKEEKKARRREYYLRNKSRMNELAKERYKRVRDDPETYKTILEKNHNAYHFKVNEKSVIPLTEEQEEDFMRKIISDVKSLR